MVGTVYTLGVWHVRPGQEDEFIHAWKSLGVIFSGLPNPPTGRGTLIRSLTDATLFYSFGPWDTIEHINAMRIDRTAQEGMKHLLDLCVDGKPGTFRVVAEA
jgi:heme-degrading monooxygenase HmoA